MCKICGGTTNRKFDNQMKCDYHFCSNCGFIFKDESHHIDESTEYDRYASHNNSFDSPGYVKMFEDFLEKIDKYITYDSLVLDYGCGPGPVLSEIMSTRGATTKTYDLYFEHSKDYQEYVYDIITVTEVIEHFKEPLRDLELALKLLKDGGLLVIRTSFIKEPFMEWWYRRDHTHVSFFNDRVFKEIASRFDLEIVYSDHFELKKAENNECSYRSNKKNIC